MDGKWYAMNIATKDLNDDLSGVRTRRRTGSGSVNGESATVYDFGRVTQGPDPGSRIGVASFAPRSFQGL